MIMTERFEDIKEEEKKQDFIGKYQDEETEESTVVSAYRQVSTEQNGERLSQ